MRKVAFVMLGLAVWSCSRTVSSPERKSDLLEEVMAIHDSVMPKMGDLRTIRRRLLEKAESSSDTVLASMLLRKADRMDSAAQSMMAWMRQFNPTYYEDQKKSIEDIRDLMNASIQEGNELLDQSSGH